MGREKFVVVGGVAAGMSAASQIKRRLPEARVIVFEKGRDVSYGACGMPYNLADPARDPEDLVVITAQEFREKRGIDLRLGHEVKEIDREAKIIRGVTETRAAFEESYDCLVLATGSRAVVPSLPGFDSDGVFTLRTLRDLASVKGWLSEKDCKSAVVIGGSYLGLELAEALTARGLEVRIVKRSPHLLKFLPQELDEKVREELDRRGVEVIHGSSLRSIRPGFPLKVELEDRELSADLVMVAMGFRPNSELGEAAGLKLGPASAISVDEFGRTSDPDIFACGDCADNRHYLTGKRVWIPLALHANRTGRIVGMNAAGASRKLPPVLGTSAVRVFGLEVAGTGLSTAEAAEEAGFEPATQTIQARTRAHAFPGAGKIWVHLVAEKKSGRLLGGAVVGVEGAALRIDVVATAVMNDMSVEAFSNLDLMYSPPFAPAWDPLLVAANQLQKKV